MKKRIFALVLTLCMTLGLLPVTAGASETEFSLSETSITLPLGGGADVSVKFGSGIDSRQVQWRQEGGACQYGYTADGSKISLLALKVGTTKMTARTQDGKYTATCNVTVIPRAEPGTAKVAGIRAFFSYSCYQYAGRSYAPLSFAVMPSELDWKTLIWTSSDKSVATVNDSGIVTCNAPGKTRIEVTTALNTKSLWYWDIEVLPALSSLPPNPETALPPVTNEEAGLAAIDFSTATKAESWVPADGVPQADTPLTQTEFNALVLRVAQTYDINLVREDGYELTQLGMKNIEAALARMGADFLKAMSKATRNAYRSDLYIHLRAPREGNYTMGKAVFDSGRATVNLYGFPGYSTIGHEFGHIAHCIISYFDKNFAGNFAAANGSRAYGSAMTGDDDQYFISNYGKSKNVEDMATVFETIFMTQKADDAFALKLAAGSAGLAEKTTLFRKGANGYIGKSPIFGLPLFTGSQSNVQASAPDSNEGQITMQASQSEFSLKVGASHATLSPLFSDQKARTFTMSSSNSAVAKIDGTKVVGVAPGVATITLAAGSGRADCVVTVWDQALAGLSVVTQPNKTNYLVGEGFDPTGLTLAYSDGVTSQPVDISRVKFTVHTTTITEGRPFSEAGVKEVVATYTLTAQAYAAKFTLRVTEPGENKPVAAIPSPTKLLVNGAVVAADAYTINQNNYIKLRDLATMINGTGKNFEIKWDGDKNAINLLSKTPYTIVGGELAQGDGQNKTATLATSAIYVDGVQKPLTAYLIGQNNYFKIRDVMETFDVSVGYDGPTSTATLDTSKGYETPAGEKPAGENPPVETPAAPQERPVSDKIERKAYYIELSGAKKQLFDISGMSRENGAALRLYQKSGAANQRFVVEAVGTLYSLKCVESGKMLTVPNAAPGTQVVQQTYTEAQNQLFTITKNSDGSVRFQTADGLFLGVSGGSSKNGTAIVTGPAATDGSQDFFLRTP